MMFRGAGVMRLQLAGGFCVALLMAGCASQTGVVPNGQGGLLDREAGGDWLSWSRQSQG
jgi:hypothetical protein